mmetsp:Transcript_37002/g.86403  ORF Transcript_37002/g.86403 Transcript_37002/m.86403 type:complete len:235 (+) Transcript_37002:1181-1885(+)
MLEIAVQHLHLYQLGVENPERVPILCPSDDMISLRVVQHLEKLAHKWSSALINEPRSGCVRCVGAALERRSGGGLHARRRGRALHAARERVEGALGRRVELQNAQIGPCGRGTSKRRKRPSRRRWGRARTEAQYAWRARGAVRAIVTRWTRKQVRGACGQMLELWRRAHRRRQHAFGGRNPLRTGARQRRQVPDVGQLSGRGRASALRCDWTDLPSRESRPAVTVEQRRCMDGA